ncbi:MAG: bacillithiol biosynthesis cysteine-adding enzyme BshC [Bacteroidota bacterium]
MQNIKYSEFQNLNVGFTNLFIDYIEQKESVKKYFNDANIQNISSWGNIIKNFNYQTENRKIVIQTLIEQNRALHCSVQTLSNIDLLQNKNTFCVVTGQQAGLFLGPLYTIYKTISAIKLCEKLKNEFPDYNFVPVFWVESEDHDLNEITTIGSITNKNEFQTFKYDVSKNNEPLKQFISAKNLLVNESISDFIKNIFDNQTTTEFSPQIQNLLNQYYAIGQPFTNSFASMISDLFRDYGLITIDISHQQFKNILKEIFRTELNCNHETSKNVIEQSYELEKEYHAQIKPRPINLFVSNQDGRYPLQPDEFGYFLQGTRKRYSNDELLNLLETSPELFSPNVVLRPICQDFLLPTISYVGGPAEIAYFSQLKKVYEQFKITMPVIFPRASCTLIEDKINNILEKHEIEPLNFLNNFSDLTNDVLEEISEVKVEKLFLEMENKSKNLFNETKYAILQIDPTLENSITNIVNKLDFSLNQLKEKVRNAQKRKEEVTVSQLLKTKNHLFPDSKLQERNITIIYFMNKYGLDIVKWLYDEVSIESFEHQFINI